MSLSLSNVIGNVFTTLFLYFTLTSYVPGIMPILLCLSIVSVLSGLKLLPESTYVDIGRFSNLNEVLNEFNQLVYS